MAKNKNRFEELGGADVLGAVIGDSGLQQKDVREKPKAKLGRKPKDPGEKLTFVAQVNGTESEKEELELAAKKAGHTHVASFIRSILIKEGIWKV